MLELELDGENAPDGGILMTLAGYKSLPEAGFI